MQSKSAASKVFHLTQAVVAILERNSGKVSLDVLFSALQAQGFSLQTWLDFARVMEPEFRRDGHNHISFGTLKG